MNISNLNYHYPAMKWFLIPLILISGFAGCQLAKDFENIEIVNDDWEFAVPVFKSKTSVKQLLDGFNQYTYLEIASDGVIHLRYQGSIIESSSQQMLKEAEGMIFPIIPILDTLFELPFSQPGQFEVDLARYKSGVIRFAVGSNHSGPVTFTMTLPQVTKNGQPARLQQVFNSPTAGIFTSTVSLDLTGYQIVPENGKVYVRYDAMASNGTRLVLPQVGLMNENVRFSYVQGYLGNYIHTGDKDILNVEFFENWTQGDVYFEKPEIKFFIENSFGIPTRSQIELFDIITADGKRLQLESDFITTKGIDFVYPSISEVGKVKTQTFTFNPANSNIEDVFSSKPKSMEYKVNAITNPDNKVNVRGFITDSSYYRIKVDADFPMYGKASGFVIRDTFDSKFNDLNDVKEVEFKLIADNNIPLSIDCQVYFVDANGKTLDSLFSNPKQRLISGAKVGSDGNVTSKTTQTTYAKVTPERFTKLVNSSKMVLKAAFSTTSDGTQSVRLKSTQDVEFRMGLKFKL